MEIRAIFVDAAGTLLRPREPVGITYARAARLFGHRADPVRVEARFRTAFKNHRGQQTGDGRAFWRPVVSEALGVSDEGVFEHVYQWYATPRAWWVDTEALKVLGRFAREGIQLGIISNWDQRLRTLYGRFALDRMFSTLICSAELEVEKPDPWIFKTACRCIGVRPREAVHIGNDPECDVAGATGAGLAGIFFDEEAGWNAIGDRISALRRLPYFGR